MSASANPTFKILTLGVDTFSEFTQDLQIFKKFNMSQMNPKKVFHNTAYSVQLP